MDNFKGRRNTSGFTQHPENINKGGRPKKLVSHINENLKAEGYEPVTNSQLKECYLQILNLPFERVKEMSQMDGNFPLLYKLVAGEMIGKRGLEMLDRLLDRAIGKPQQSFDHTSGGERINLTISKEDSEL